MFKHQKENKKQTTAQTKKKNYLFFLRGIYIYKKK
jgi:hypothetical protein